ncbi:unnamed protein product, partial [Brenthis ino]
MLIVAPECDVMPIAQWEGSPSKRQIELVKPVTLVVVQHTVTKECSTDADCEKIANGIRSFQINDVKFDDIGQSFLIGGNGKVYEGAGWRVGAHTLGYNDKSISMSFLGDFREKLPSEQALKAAQDFLSCSVDNNNLNGEYYLVGHMQLSATLSPGATLQSHIETWPHWLNDTSNI